ncbi:MAG: hypothetical protein ABIL09_01405, partial [Gemmatimonadota bacterium]
MRAIPTLLAALALAAPAAGVERITYGLDSLRTWQYPAGLVTVESTGVQAKRFGGAANAVSTMDEFQGLLIGVHGSAPVRTQSNAAAADLVRDGDPDTWWAPSPADPVDRWWIELDLGRTVVADKLSLTFPDNGQAHPLTFFAVLTSPGVAILGNASNLYWTRVDRPGQLNTDTVVEYDLSTRDTGNATGDYLVGNLSTPHPWSLVRFIRIEAEAQPPGGALAEVEVREIGYNIATRITTEYRVQEGLESWGGSARTSDTREDEFRADGGRTGKAANPESLISSDLAGRHWAIESQNQPDWRSSGAWWVLDMGSIYRIDRLVWLPIVNGFSPLHYGYARDKTGRWKLFDFLFSDGTPDNEANPFVEGSFDYQLLSSVDNCGEDASKNCTRDGQSYFDFQFPARSMRYLMWRRMSDEQLSKALQVWVFHAEGYPAQVEFESADMDLGGARSIGAVEWDADAPPGTRIEVLTQTGNGYTTVTRYYDAAGREVTKDAWELLKARQRGPVVEDMARDGSWSSWSEPHRVSGERFLSPTPRRWMRARVRLISEDPDLFP